ncbi:MAG: ATP-binding protein [Lachnospiraceae bacterium]
MKKKINVQLMGIATLAILLTLISVSAVFYELFRERIFQDLKSQTQLINQLLEEKNHTDAGEIHISSTLRVTLIDSGGQVKYDSAAAVDELDNHSERKEVREAVETGEGYASRHSDTLKKDYFYYAFKRADGDILRVSQKADNLFSLFYQAVPVLIFLILLLFLLCVIFAHFLTAKLLSPIEALSRNMDGRQELETYEELKPFMRTIYKQHEDILKSARIRQDFTANVSHELKTPLTAISGYAQLIENGMAGKEDVLRFSHEIDRNATRLLTLINDIIRLSELDSSEMEYSFEPIRLDLVAAECVENLRMNAKKHSVSLRFEGEEATVLADRDMLEELLNNLCDNAIRYNNEGGSVIVSVKAEQKRVLLTVQDTGIGIPREHQGRIFERFYRVDKSRSKSTGGTGLGLAIVKHIVFRFHAHIELWSEPGRGTRIQITFPVKNLRDKI